MASRRRLACEGAALEDLDEVVVVVVGAPDEMVVADDDVSCSGRFVDAFEDAVSTLPDTIINNLPILTI